MKRLTFLVLIVAFVFPLMGQTRADEDILDLVNPFIGTTNYGTTHPGPVLPNGLMSVSPFNVTGSEVNRVEKDSTWWSTPYLYDNLFSIGFSHVNLSGVGCPELSGLLLMPVTGPLETDYHLYGDTLTKQTASPGYYSTVFSRQQIKAEVSTTLRSSIARFTMPEGEGHVILNLGEGLTNESGATLRFLDDSTAVGLKMMGGFCYNPDVAFPLYFAIRVSGMPQKVGAFKRRRPMGVEAMWDAYAGRNQLYEAPHYRLVGDDLGAFFSYDCKESETILVRMGVSLTSEEAALANLLAEQPTADFYAVHEAAREAWRDVLGRVELEGGTRDEQAMFYTALYHSLIHPNIQSDVPQAPPGNDERTAYSVFSLWDTYRTVHPLLSLLYPDRQLSMVSSIIDFYRINGHLPRWELYGKETLTMEGDPSLIVINDTYQRGLRDFDIATAYEAMSKSATLPSSENKIRPDNDDYLERAYVPIRSEYDNSVSHAMEYYLADWNLSRFAEALGYKDDARRFKRQSLAYKHYYSEAYKCMRPITPDGEFLSPFDPLAGRNFSENPGFHEGCALNYTFFVPHDVKGLARLMGGEKAFTERLLGIFRDGYFDPTNEPDIAYPYLFTYFPRQAWRTPELTREILRKNYHNKPGGLPGNDDTGTLSSWLIFTMLGFYPDCPGDPNYALTAPTFPAVTIKLDKHYYPSGQLRIEVEREDNSPDAIYIREVVIDGKPSSRWRLSHKSLTSASVITFRLSKKP